MISKSGIFIENKGTVIPKSLVIIINRFMQALKTFEEFGTFKPFEKIYNHNYVFAENKNAIQVLRKQKIKVGDLHAVSSDVLHDDSLVVFQVLDAEYIEESEVIKELKRGNVVEFNKENGKFYVVLAETY